MSGRAAAGVRAVLGSGLRAGVALALLASPGAGADGEPALDQDEPNALIETYRDWTVRCQTVQAGEQAAGRRCEMAQELRQADQRLVFGALIAPDEAGGARIVFVAPFGLALQDGLRLLKDGEERRTVAFSTCYATGCVAEAAFDEAAMDLFLDGEEAGVSMTAVSGERVDVALSLAGFDGAWRRLRSLSE